MPKGKGDWCAVACCSNYRGKTNDISYFRFPKDPKLKNYWVLKCCRADKFNTETKNCTICSTHFRPEDFIRDMKAELLGLKTKPQLKEGCVPSQNLPIPHQPSTSLGIRRRERMLVNDKKKVHFKDSQFENIYVDGKRKLRPNAIPTLFDVPNKIEEANISKSDSILLKRRIYKEERDNQESGDELPRKITLLKTENESLKDELREKEVLLSKIALLEKENESLRKAIKAQDKVLLSFLTEEQIDALDKHKISYWNHKSVTFALKMKRNLGKKGYNYLRNTGYPLPSISTINRKIQEIKLNMVLDINGKDINRDIMDKIGIDADDVDENIVDEDNISENDIDEVDLNESDMEEDDISDNS